MTTPTAVLFDLDGTLIDSEPVWMQAQARLTAEWNVPWTHEDNLRLVGLHLMDSARYIHDRGVGLPPADIVLRLSGEVNAVLRTDVPMRPGALETLRMLGDAGVPLALVTMSTRSTVDIVLEGMTHTLGFAPFAVTVAGDEVTNGKPAPDPYLRGLELLGVKAEGAVGVEDSFPGVAASLAAGLRTVGIPHNADVSGVDGVVAWTTLAGSTIEDFASLVEEHTR